MRRETIKYTDYDGVEREEDFYFNLKESELTMLQMSENGGYAELLERITKLKDVPAIAKVFEDILRLSYGVKTPDGRGFIKRQEDYESFKATEAYSELFMHLLNDPSYAAEFFTQVIPTKYQGDVKTEMMAKMKAQGLQI